MIQLRGRRTCRARSGAGSPVVTWEDLMSEATAHLESALEGIGRWHGALGGDAPEQSCFELARFGALVALDALGESSVATWLGRPIAAPTPQGSRTSPGSTTIP
jgi:hypothetical protein